MAACLQWGGIGIEKVDAVSFYGGPLLKFERPLYLIFRQRGFTRFATRCRSG
jgi:hypothetical protein